MNNLDFDIAIVGGGLVGASLALALAPRFRVALIERSPDPAAGLPAGAWDSRIFAVSPGSLGFLNRIGAWQAMPQERVGTIREMDVRGDQGGVIHFDALEVAADHLAVTVENGTLQAALWQAMAGQVALMSDVSVAAVRFEADRAVLTLAGGRDIAAQLAVAADGARSWLRDAAGIGFARQPYGQQGVVANFICERPHQGIARQWFREDGILAWLPLPGNRISMVWSTPDAHAAALMALSPTILADKVAAAGQYALGAFEVLTPAAAFPLALGRADQVVGKRLALVGDAAHTVHPLAGQGVNLGFGDAALLSDLLLRHAGTDVGLQRLLSSYARGRAEEVLTMQTLCDALCRLFAKPDPLLRGLRNLGLDLTNHVSPIKRALMRRAFQ
ncbi:MAG: UbiH/UbiF family hydroxylase [Burkholderiales bacterium]|nr:UbiH/UbiF family hydroxylase [Burkholderiales bacterium]